MTYLYYKTSTYTSNQKPSEKTINQWKHLSEKKNWRITQLPNGFYQTECSNPENEAAINGSIEHFNKKLEATKGAKVVKTFK
jgi:hypothetical protein